MREWDWRVEEETQMTYPKLLCRLQLCLGHVNFSPRVGRDVYIFKNVFVSMRLKRREGARKRWRMIVKSSSQEELTGKEERRKACGLVDNIAFLPYPLRTETPLCLGYFQKFTEKCM